MPAIVIEPTATTVAGDEPETAANSAQASTDAIARPPRSRPVSAIAKSMSRRATPPLVRNVPATMKNGTASSG